MTTKERQQVAIKKTIKKIDADLGQIAYGLIESAKNQPKEFTDFSGINFEYAMEIVRHRVNQVEKKHYGEPTDIKLNARDLKV